MAIEITVPRLGWSMEEGVFSQWLKRDGDAVREGDALYELESDKAVQQVESFDAGILSIPSDGPKSGDVVKVGQRLGYLCRRGEQAPQEGTPASGARSESRAQEDRVTEPQADPPISVNQPPTNSNGRQNGLPDERPIASPSVRRLARQIGVDVQSLRSDDVAGRITAEQVLAFRQAASDAPAPTPRPERETTPPEVRVSPRAARTALRLGVDLSQVAGSGSSGRIREHDVVAAAARDSAAVRASMRAPIDDPPREIVPPAPAPKAAKETAMSSLRRTIAARMLAAAQQTASVTLTSSADATELVNIRKQYRAAADPALRIPSFTDLLVKLVATALERHPEMLGQWTDEGIIVPHGVHVAVAVDTPAGLLTPVLRDVPDLSLTEISDRLSSLITRARSRRVAANELQGGVFTISNLGGYRVDVFTPILNLPQAAILGVGRISPQPIAVGGQVEVRDCVTFSLTFDHRVVDGATAAALLTTICEFVERPLPTLLS